MWLGIGDALLEAREGGQLDLLQDMYDNWPFFKVGSFGCEGWCEEGGREFFC